MIILVLSATLSLVLSCGDGGEASPSAAVQVGAQTTAGTNNPQPSQFSERLEGALPAEFPKDFPIYTPAEIARGDTLDARYAIDLRSEEEMDAVVEYYREGLSTPPWQTTDEESSEWSVIFKYRSKDGAYQGEVAIGKLQERTWILIAMDHRE